MTGAGPYGNPARFHSSGRADFRDDPTAQTAARLNLVWGVTPVLTERAALPSVRETILARHLWLAARSSPWCSSR